MYMSVHTMYITLYIRSLQEVKKLRSAQAVMGRCVHIYEVYTPLL